MPSSGPPYLSPSERALIADWIAEGAHDTDQHEVVGDKQRSRPGLGRQHPMAGMIGILELEIAEVDEHPLGAGNVGVDQGGPPVGGHADVRV